MGSFTEYIIVGWLSFQHFKDAVLFSSPSVVSDETSTFICPGSPLLFWFSCWLMSDSLWPIGLQHTRLPCPSPSLRACSNSCPLSWWYHPTFLSYVIPFSSCLLPFLAWGSLLVSQFSTSGAQSIRVSASASVLPMNIQDWFPLGWTGWISL